jgi:hypothetical protein
VHLLEGRLQACAEEQVEHREGAGDEEVVEPPFSKKALPIFSMKRPRAMAVCIRAGAEGRDWPK